MNDFNSSNAYKLRYDDGAVRKPKKKQSADKAPQKHIRPNMTVRLNRMDDSRSKRKRMLAAKPIANPFRSFNPAQVRVLVAFGFAFGVLMSFFVFTIRCQVKDNELTHLINERKATLEDLNHDYEGLVVKQQSLLNDSYIQEYAEQNLGMQKRVNHQIGYFTVRWEDDFGD